MHMMKGILFDFNGTLYDDTRFHVAAWTRYFHEAHGIDFTREEVRRRFMGPDNEMIFRDVFGNDITEEQIDAWSSGKEAMYRAAASATPENLQLMEGASQMFDELVRRGIPFALATSSRMDNIRFYMNDLGLKKWFTMDRVVYIDGRIAPKPDPAFYTEAAHRIGLEPADCIVVEDSKSGIQGAVNAGAGRIIAIDRTLGADCLAEMPEVYASIHDFYQFMRFIPLMQNL